MNHFPAYLTKRLFIAATLAGLGAEALAQNTAPVPAIPTSEVHAAHPHPRLTPEQWRAYAAHRHATYLANLKAALNITSNQESVWSQFEVALQLPAPPKLPQPSEWARLTTPDRIDWLEQNAADRQQHIKQRDDAIKAFYAQLIPGQQKIFDARTAHLGPHGHGPILFGPHGKPGGDTGQAVPHVRHHPVAKSAPQVNQAE